MQISKIPCSNLSFKAISLNQDESRCVDELLTDLYCEKSLKKQEKTKLDLFTIYDFHIKKEASERAFSRVHISEIDYMQNLYLKLFELIENAKSSVCKEFGLTTSLNEVKPAHNATIQTDKSLNAPLYLYGDGVTLDKVITEEQLPVYASSSSDSEKEFAKNIVNEKIAQTKELTSKELLVIEGRAAGKSFSKIAMETNVKAQGGVRNHFLVALAKIQLRTGTLPPNYTELAQLMIDEYKLDKTVLDVQHSLVKAAEDMTKSPKELVANINETAALLEVSGKEYAELVLKNPTLLGKPAKTINRCISDIAKVLEINKKSAVKLGMKSSSLFFRDPNSIKANVDDLVKFLDVEKKEIVKAACLHPSLITNSPKYIAKNISDCANLLQMSPKEYLSFAFKQSRLFTTTDKKMNKILKDAVKMLSVQRDDYISAAKKQPALFYLPIKTVKKKVNSASKLLGVSSETYIKMALRQPTLFYQKPKTINSHAQACANLLKISKAQFVEIAQRHPVLLCMKPETIAKKVDIVEYFKQIRGEKQSKIMIYTDSDKVLFTDILRHLVKTQEKMKSLKEKEFKGFLVKNEQKTYKFTIPKNKLVDEFIQFCEKFSLEVTGKQMFKFVVRKI